MISLVPLALVALTIGGVAMWLRHRAAGDGVDSAGTSGRPPGRISLVTEAVCYVGAILVLSGAVAAIAQQWKHLALEGRIAVLGAAALLLFAVGALFRNSLEPALLRLTGATWALSVVAFAGCAVVVNQFYATSSETAFLLTATTSTAYAAGLWWYHRQALQQVAMFVGLLLSTASVIVRAIHEPAAWAIAVPLWAVGVVWVAAGWSRRLAPWFIAIPTGLLVALVAPAAIDNVSGLRFGLGIGTAGVVMAVAVASGFTPVLIMASVAMLGYVIAALVFYFGSTLGAPVAFAIGGLLILGLTAAATHWHWFGRHPPGDEPPSIGGAPNHTTAHHRRAA